MIEHLANWPVWYWMLAAYTAGQSIRAGRRYARIAATLREAERRAPTVSARRHLQGRRAGGWARVASWLVAGVLLLTGWNWVRMLVAAAYASSATRSFREYATGFAEGRKAASLAAAPEFVAGRVSPRPMDFMVAALFVGVTRGVPLVALLYAIGRLPATHIAWVSLGAALLWTLGAVGVLVMLALVWVSLSTRPVKETVSSLVEARQLLERLVSRGTHLASVEFRVRGQRGRSLKFTKYLSDESRCRWVIRSYSPTSELRIVSTLIEPKGAAAGFENLVRELEAAGLRLTPRRSRRGRRILQLNHGRSVESATALLGLVFQRVFDANVARDAEAVTNLILDSDVPHLTGVGTSEQAPTGL